MVVTLIDQRKCPCIPMDDPTTDANPDLEKTRSLISHLKQEIDELVLQLELGKADAVDFVEKQKHEMRGLLDQVQSTVDAGKGAAGDQASALKQKLDELHLQLALGRMESADTLAEQREKISGAIDATHEFLEPVETSLKERVEFAGESLKTKVNALALDLGIRKAVAEEELLRTKEGVMEDLKGIKQVLQPAVDGVEESLEEIGRQAGEKFKEIKNRLGQLFD